MVNFVCVVPHQYVAVKQSVH